MSYLLRYPGLRNGPKRKRRKNARADECLALNLPGYYGDALIRTFVEDTSATLYRVGSDLPGARIRLQITDCTNEINLEFSLDTEGERVNALHKTDTLLGALTRFRAALAAEAELRVARERAHTLQSVPTT